MTQTQCKRYVLAFAILALVIVFVGVVKLLQESTTVLEQGQGYSGDVQVPNATGGDARIELEKRGNVRFKTPAEIERDAEPAPAPAPTPAPAKQAGAAVREAEGLRLAIESLTKVLNDEQEAYDQAELNALRRACWFAALDLKVAVENAQGVGIQDWGRVQDAPVCVSNDPDKLKEMIDLLEMRQAEAEGTQTRR